VIQELRERVLDNSVKITDREVAVDVNTGDNYYEGIVYLTVTGLSFENGDDGSVGRGNRVNGLITPYRPMSLEAAAGKNPVTHVGKLYNLLAFEVAHKITNEAKGDIEEAWVRIVSQIGKPIDEPQVAVAQLSLAEGVKIGGVKANAEGIIDDGLSNIDKLTDKVVAGKVRVF
jgi:S-adenosylmethionine synthetase